MSWLRPNPAPGRNAAQNPFDQPALKASRSMVQLRDGHVPNQGEAKRSPFKRVRDGLVALKTAWSAPKKDTSVPMVNRNAKNVLPADISMQVNSELMSLERLDQQINDIPDSEFNGKQYKDELVNLAKTLLRLLNQVDQGWDESKGQTYKQVIDSLKQVPDFTTEHTAIQIPGAPDASGSEASERGITTKELRYMIHLFPVEKLKSLMNPALVEMHGSLKEHRLSNFSTRTFRCSGSSRGSQGTFKDWVWSSIDAQVTGGEEDNVDNPFSDRYALPE